METTFVAVTVIALALGIGLSVLGWKLLSDDRRRSAARLDRLQTLSMTDEPDLQPMLAPAVPVPLPAAAAVRFAAIDDGDHREEWDGRLGATPIVTRPRVQFSPAPSIDGDVDLFTTATVAPTGGGRRWLVLAAVAVVVLGSAGTVYALHRPAGASAPVVQPSTAADAASAKPLELLSLRNSTDADGAFVVTGLVGNPADGRSLRGVVAVIYLFDRDGNYFASNRSAIDLSALPPGDQSPFVVKVPSAAGVSRYRVGFRLGDGGVVAHIDHRGQPVDGLTEGTSVAPAPAVTPLSAPAGARPVHGATGH